MLRTGLVSLAFALLGCGAGAWLTEGFRVWTAEGARRLEVIEQPVSAPPVWLHEAGRDAPAVPLARLLRGDGASIPTVVDFVYTRCESVCLSLGSGFEQLQRAIAADPQRPVRLLSISFDPAHDDPPTLARYAERLRADRRVWRFATPASARDLSRLLAAYRVVVIPDGRGGFEHNAALLVIDARGRLVRIFDWDQLELALAYARSLGAGAG
jgi:protein SCO1/2